jgi:haloalkane dehalogenase
MPTRDDWLPTSDAESRYVDIGGGRHIHYIEAGTGDPVVFLHGNPTSSYLWRHVIPHVAPRARCLAPDLIGMGYSDKPDIAYRFGDHYSHIRAFIDALALEGVTFVAHDWGGSLAFRYLAEHPGRVRGLAFMEVMLEGLTWAEMPLDFRLGFRLMRASGFNWALLGLANAFVNAVLPMATRTRLSKATMRRYREPFPTVASRRPVRQWPREVPLNGRPADNAATFRGYTEALRNSRVPKLLCYSEPGAVVRRPRREWAVTALPSLETVYVGEGVHFMPEEHPGEVGRAVADWYSRNIAGGEPG